jgi:hypothetical protein
VEHGEKAAWWAAMAVESEPGGRAPSASCWARWSQFGRMGWLGRVASGLKKSRGKKWLVGHGPLQASWAALLRGPGPVDPFPLFSSFPILIDRILKIQNMNFPMPKIFQTYYGGGSIQMGQLSFWEGVQIPNGF